MEVLRHNNKDTGNMPGTDYGCQTNGNVPCNNHIAKCDEFTGE